MADWCNIYNTEPQFKLRTKDAELLENQRLALNGQVKEVRTFILHGRFTEVTFDGSTFTLKEIYERYPSVPKIAVFQKFGEVTLASNAKDVLQTFGDCAVLCCQHTDAEWHLCTCVRPECLLVQLML